VIRANLKLACTALAFALAVLSPAANAAEPVPGSGGGAGGGSGGVSPGDAGGPAVFGPLATPVNVALTATGGGLTLTTNASAMLSHRVAFRGWAPSSMAGDTVVIERRPAGSRATWTPTAQTTVAPGGSYSAAWLASQTGRLSLRALVEAQAPAAPAGTPGLAAVASAGGLQATLTSLTITVFRVQVASWYGPGLYGRRTACGERLRPQSLGVASLTLPCGAMVELDYRGRAIVVPVIDRGPYVPGVQWDLTQATAVALGMPETDRIGAVAVRARASVKKRVPRQA
jgi:hypothetical protein